MNLNFIVYVNNYFDIYLVLKISPVNHISLKSRLKCITKSKIKLISITI